MSAAMTLEELQTLLEELFPVRSELQAMELGDTPAVSLVPPGPRDSGAGLRVTIRLLHWERLPKSKQLQLRDIKEQEVYLGPAALLQNGERLEAFLRGLCAALQIVFDANSDQIETLMPHDLLPTNVLKLARPQTADDFQRALLVPSRLGRYVPR